MNKRAETRLRSIPKHQYRCRNQSWVEYNICLQMHCVHMACFKNVVRVQKRKFRFKWIISLQNFKKNTVKTLPIHIACVLTYLTYGLCHKVNPSVRERNCHTLTVFIFLLYLYYIYIISLFHLYYISITSIFYLYFYFISILSLFYIYSTSIQSPFYLCYISFLSLFCLYSIHILTLLYLFSISIISLQLLLSILLFQMALKFIEWFKTLMTVIFFRAILTNY